MRSTHPALPLLACAALAAAACGRSPSPSFYTLTSTAAPAGAPSGGYSIAVGPVSVPAFVDRPQLVVQVAPNRVTFEEFNRWAAPLDDLIARAVAGDLSALLGTPRVVAGALASFEPDFRVAIDVLRFESVRSERVLVEAVWTVRGRGETRTGRTVARATPSGGDLDALAAAHSRALATVSADIAEAIRTIAATREGARPR